MCIYIMNKIQLSMNKISESCHHSQTALRTITDTEHWSDHKGKILQISKFIKRFHSNLKWLVFPKFSHQMLIINLFLQIIHMWYWVSKQTFLFFSAHENQTTRRTTAGTQYYYFSQKNVLWNHWFWICSENCRWTHGWIKFIREYQLRNTKNIRLNLFPIPSLMSSVTQSTRTDNNKI